MPWRTVVLRGTRVLARCEADGKLREEDGKVEIRYRPGDGKAYRALARNLEPVVSEAVLPDAHCVDASAAPASASGAGRGTATATSSAGRGTAAGRKQAAAAGFATRVVEGEHVAAYTDGACSGNPGPAGLGVVMLRGTERSELSEYLGVGTNNVAELTAILRAIEAFEGELPLLVHTDSQYAIGVLTKGWKPKVNQELIARIKNEMKRVKQLSLVYVPGHAGVPLNERADELARAAVTARATSGWQAVRSQHVERA
jgi:ribonuclease HI